MLFIKRFSKTCIGSKNLSFQALLFMYLTWGVFALELIRKYRVRNFQNAEVINYEDNKVNIPYQKPTIAPPHRVVYDNKSTSFHLQALRFTALA